MSINAKELAEKLGISAAAVSMALNGKSGVSEVTRSRVLAAAKEYGYDFSKVKLSSSTVGRFAFLLYKKHGAVVGDTPFFSDLTEGITRACREYGYTLDIQYILETDSTKAEVGKLLRSGIDGIILLGTEMQKVNFSAFNDLPVPLIVLDTYFDGLEKNCVLINNVQGAYIATNYLIQKLQSSPGYLHSSYSIGNFEERADGFYKAVRENGYSSSQAIVHKLAPSIDGAYADMKALLSSGVPLAKGYFADNDNIAIGAMRAFKEAGYSIPKDIGIIGFDNTSLCELIEPNLTTVNVPKQAMGKMAVERLLALIKDENAPVTKLEVCTSLIRRDSL